MLGPPEDLPAALETVSFSELGEDLSLPEERRFQRTVALCYHALDSLASDTPVRSICVSLQRSQVDPSVCGGFLSVSHTG